MQCPYCHNNLPDDAAYCPQCGTRVAGVPEPATFEYSAFISYRHRERDAEVAAKVQQAIETYTLPPDIAATYGSPKFARVFRDQDELPATDSLPDTIREALAASHALIVVCTPETPQSRWVASEIETFAQMHGRQNIHLVLAEGTSAESIPPMLRTRIAVQPDGTVAQVSTEPLAADMRPEADSRFNQEKLRLIAGLAGCNLDALVQREQARRRKRTIRIGVAAALLVALIVGLGVFAASNSREAQVAQARRLAAESQQLYQQGDRIGAIERALEALPSSSSDTSRPVVPEAQQALEQALQVGDGTWQPWVPEYTIQTNDAIGSLYSGAGSSFAIGDDHPGNGVVAVQPEGEWFAVSDTGGTISIFDIATGRLRGVCEMPRQAVAYEDGIFLRELAAAGDSLVVSNMNGDNSVLAAFDAANASFIGADVDYAPISGLAYMDADGQSVAGVNLNMTGDHLSIRVDVRVGEKEGLVAFHEEGLLDGDVSYGFYDVGAGAYYFAAGRLLVRINPETKQMVTTPLAYIDPVAMDAAGSTLIVTSADMDDYEVNQIPIAVQAFDSDMRELWHYEKTESAQMLVNKELTPAEGDSKREIVTVAEGFPCIAGFLLDGRYIAVTFGREVSVLDMETGNVVWSRTLSSNVVGANVVSRAGETNNAIAIATCDGALVVKQPFGDATTDAEGDETRFQLGRDIRWASFVADDDGELRVIAIPADSTNEFICYLNAAYHSEHSEPDSYTLDELLALAHEQLEAAGRG